MNATRAAVLVAFLLVLPRLGLAQPGPSAQQEIKGLLHAVAASQCRFVRGDTAYTAEQARDHLTRKFDYLAARGLVRSAEDFIAQVATRSSMTGQGYAIHCPDAPTQQSDEWLRLRLSALRQGPLK